MKKNYASGSAGGITEGEIEFYEVEMGIDRESFIGEEDEITPGKYVSFRYLTGDSGPPINPKIYTIREDILDWNEKVAKKLSSHTPIWKPTDVRSDWRDIGTHRRYFDAFALQKKFDPLQPSNWYTVTAKDFLKKLVFVQNYYSDSLVRALTTVYPEIGLDPSKFPIIPRYHWDNADNRRAFFEEYARDMGFDPLIAENWYKVEFTSLLNSHPKAWSLLHNYKNPTFSKILMDVFPFIGLAQHNFLSTPRRYYSNTENRRLFFDRFAAARGFDPLVRENWYSITRSMIVCAQGGPGIMRHFNSVSSALIEAYPNLGFEKRHFRRRKP